MAAFIAAFIACPSLQVLVLYEVIRRGAIVQAFARRDGRILRRFVLEDSDLNIPLGLAVAGDELLLAEAKRIPLLFHGDETPAKATAHVRFLDTPAAARPAAAPNCA